VALRAARAVGALVFLGAAGPAWGQGSPPPIRDNSFLIEEAYNQDRNVVQHIATFTDTRNGIWALGFTDEWPVDGVRNQVSVGATLVDNSAAGEFGVFAFNYRRQLVANPDAAVIVSPRLSLFADVGSAGKSPYALQVNVPVTAVLSGALVSHWNLGGTVGAGPALVNAGASVVWLALPWMNFLVEGLFVGASGEAPTYVVSPGVRWAFNLGAAQVVPGVAFPLDVHDRDDDAIFLYLSLEHPFGPLE
jgi:hypothetical protein